MSWSKEASRKLVRMYKEGSTVEDLMVEFARTKASIINKLVKEKAYCKPVKTTIPSKKVLVRRLQAETGLTTHSAVKMDKKDLLLLVEWLETL